MNLRMVSFSSSSLSVSEVFSVSKTGNNARQSRHRFPIALGRLAQRELRVVREQQPLKDQVGGYR